MNGWRVWKCVARRESYVVVRFFTVKGWFTLSLNLTGLRVTSTRVGGQYHNYQHDIQLIICDKLLNFFHHDISLKSRPVTVAILYATCSVHPSRATRSDRL